MGIDHPLVSRTPALCVPLEAAIKRLGVTMTDDDPEIEFSPLCGSVTRDGITIQVQIYRVAGSPEGWSLEVIDQEDASTVWDDFFASDEEAYAEFYRTLEAEGIRSFAERPAGRPN